MRLEFRGVRKAFGAHPVIGGLDADFEFEHALAFVGPSGGGKSTLLRLVAGLIAPDQGQVSVDGVPIPKDSEGLRRYRAGIGTVFQAFNLFPHLSALENLLLPLRRVHGVPEAEARTRAEAALERFGLAAHAAKRPAALSGGQRQRVAIARAVVVRPKFLLFDEPTSALDPEMTAEVLDLIRDLRDEGRSMVLVTHEMGFARLTADTVAFVAGGTIVESAAAESFFASPSTEEAARFLGRILKY